LHVAPEDEKVVRCLIILADLDHATSLVGAADAVAPAADAGGLSIRRAVN